ncbi:MAG: methyltransferase [bacterium]|nr:methyltransferase [bacterium]
MSHYYSAKQESPLQLKKIEAVLRGKRFSFFTGSGVFSKDKIDYGTAVLAEYMHVSEKDRVLDLGCGIGIIGKIAATLTKKEVVLVDVNARAVELAKRNTKGIDTVKVFVSDAYEKLHGEKFDVILFNPPQSAGKKLCLQMIADAKEHLNIGGNIQIVARHNKGGETFSKYMQEIYGNVETLCKKGGYRVYKSLL